MSRWTLPGPDRWLAALVEDVYHGGAVAVRVPSTIDPHDIWAEVVRRAPASVVHLVEIEGDRGLPADVLAEQAGLEGAGWTAAALASCADLAGQILCVVGSERTRGPERWAGLFSEFASATSTAAGEPPVLIVVAAGDADAVLPPPNPLLRVHWWWGVVDRLDVAVHLKDLDHRLDAVDREQLIEVAGGDLDLVEALAASGCRDVASIAGLCVERAAELDYGGQIERHPRIGPDPGLHAEAWSAGVVDAFEGREHWHAGLLARVEPRQLERRIWTAQVRSLLPMIDLWRMELIELARNHKLVPEHLLTLDLEVGELSRLLARARDRHSLGELSDWLRRSRNHLAHLEVVPPQTRDAGLRLVARAGLTV